MNPVTDIPVLETERLILRGWRADDLEPVADIYADAEYARFVSRSSGTAEAWKKLAAFAGHWALHGFGPFAIECRAGGETIGYAGPWNPAGKADEPEISYGLRPAFNGKGYAAEAVVRSLDWWYRERGAKRAVSFIDPANSRSLKLVQHLGAVHESDGSIYDGAVAVQIWRYPAPEDFFISHAQRH